MTVPTYFRLICVLLLGGSLLACNEQPVAPTASDAPAPVSSSDGVCSSSSEVTIDALYCRDYDGCFATASSDDPDCGPISFRWVGATEVRDSGGSSEAYPICGGTTLEPIGVFASDDNGSDYRETFVDCTKF